MKKLSIENFNEKCLIYVNTNKCIFNISISNLIVVEVDNNQDRFNSNFYNETYRYHSVDDFKKLFNKLVLRATNKERQELKVKYKGRDYPIYIELSSIDNYRSLGTEKKYDLNIYDSKGKGHFVAQVSEYPLGIFNLVHVFEGFEIRETEIINFFELKK
ncbi:MULTISPECIES: hypothetical protein [unclassified Paraflavitalea]|uniref:hypothetical protein n=1 Tax=unclassified Paraflavitalea TaxID=2798305 RepID=UPI003D32BB81